MTDLSKLTGTVRTLRPQSSNPYGIPWSNIARYAAYIDEAAQRYGAEPERIAAHIVIESDGDPDAVQKNDSNGWSYGLMQVVPYGVGWTGWHQRVISLFGLAQWKRQQVITALYDPRINILVGTSILADSKNQYGSWDKASSAFFTDGPNWGGSDTVNGTTGRAYRDTLRALMNEITNQQTTTPETEPTMTEQDILNLISNRAPGVYISFPFLGLNTDNAGRPVNIYSYGKGHGTTANNMHPGIDIWMPDNTPINAVFGGEIVCVGGNGRVVWGQGCGFFLDDNGGVGNITILTNAKATINGKAYQLKMTYGHCSTASVAVGQKITDGQRIGTSGIGSGWPHVHLDVTIPAPELNNPAIWNNGGEYHLVDPIPTILNALGAGTITPQPTYDAPRIDVPQPGEFDGKGWTVTATEDGVPVKQYADRAAPDVNPPLKKGNGFTAVYIAYGRDGEAWWVSSMRGRVPVAGTACPAVFGGEEPPDDLTPIYNNAVRAQDYLDLAVEALKTRVEP